MYTLERIATERQGSYEIGVSMNTVEKMERSSKKNATWSVPSGISTGMRQRPRDIRHARVLHHGYVISGVTNAALIKHARAITTTMSVNIFRSQNYISQPICNILTSQGTYRLNATAWGVTKDFDEN